jgi:hypothetical protein
MSDVKVSSLKLVQRWAFGMALVSWRYLWQTTPLHRWERRESAPVRAPDVPDEVRADRLQPWTDGVGDLYHRLFRVRVADAHIGATELMSAVTGDLSRFVPREVVHLRRGGADGRALRVNDDFVVDMPGPWNGPVRVAMVTPTRLRLVTLAGHLEAGEIEFRAADDAPHLVFEVETWARSGSRLVHVLYSRLRLAKEIQLNMWLRFCCSAAAVSGGRIDGGVEIGTVISPAAAGVASPARGSGDRPAP